MHAIVQTQLSDSLQHFSVEKSDSWSKLTQRNSEAVFAAEISL